MPLNDKAYSSRQSNRAESHRSFFETKINYRLAYLLRLLIVVLSLWIWYDFTFILSIYWLYFGSIPAVVLAALFIAKAGFRYELVRWAYFTLIVFAVTPLLFIILGIKGDIGQL